MERAATDRVIATAAVVVTDQVAAMAEAMAMVQAVKGPKSISVFLSKCQL